MKTLAIVLLLWSMTGGTMWWAVLAFLLWEFGGNASVIGSLWLSGRIHGHHEE